MPNSEQQPLTTEMAVEALRRSEEQFLSLIQEMPYSIVIHRGSKVLFMNQATSDLMGYDWDEVKDMSVSDFIHPDDLHLVAQRQEAIERGEVVPAQGIRFLKRDGSVVVAETHGYPTTFDGEEARIAVHRDLTAQIKAEQTAQKLRDHLEQRVEERTQQLKESERNARQQSRLLRAVTDVVTSFIDTRDWKSAGTQLVREAINLTGNEYGFLGELHGETLRVIWSQTEGREYDEQVFANIEKDDYAAFDELDNLFGVVVATGKPILSNNAPADSRASKRLPVGRPEPRSFLGAPILKDGKVNAMIGVVNGKQTYTDTDLRTMEYLCQAASVVFDNNARTAREAALEEQLQQAAKMEALGVLAGGIAHDFNNLLSTIQGNAEVALTSSSNLDGKTREMLQDIVTASNNAAGLCNQMLAYAGRGVLSTQCFECNTLISEIGGLLQVALSKKVTLEFDLHDEALFVEADRGQLGQVLMNLITNGAEALGSGPGRVIASTSARYYSLDELLIFAPNAALAAGEYVSLTVSDTGPGMDAETQSKIFDPFFTTKFTGRGLGLAAVQGIVQRHHGAIRLESEPGKGATFTVLLPRALEPPSHPTKEAEVSLTGVGKRILVVDDEPPVLKILKRMIESDGFEVVTASSGYEALEVFSREHGTIDCVLLDLTMPDLDGEETLHALLKRPRFSWTRIKGESNVQGGGGNGSIEGRGTGRGIGADGGSPKGDWSPCRRGGGRGGLPGAGAAVERQPEARRGAAAAAWRIAGGAVP